MKSAHLEVNFVGVELVKLKQEILFEYSNRST